MAGASQATIREIAHEAGKKDAAGFHKTVLKTLGAEEDVSKEDLQARGHPAPKLNKTDTAYKALNNKDTLHI